MEVRESSPVRSALGTLYWDFVANTIFIIEKWKELLKRIMFLFEKNTNMQVVDEKS